jgi:fumarylacetoacetase
LFVARDFQQLEMIPVGPLNSKHGATSVSAWIVTPDALAPFKSTLNERAKQLAPHLDFPGGKQLSVGVSVAVDGSVQGKTNTKEMDWTFEQLIAHQSSAGCGMRAGDMLAIGTISGPGDDEQGCMLEQRIPGSTPRRGYLEDGEEVQLVGYCGEGVGFGECRGRLVSAADRSIWESSP